jgi:hypothetical protein
VQSGQAQQGARENGGAGKCAVAVMAVRLPRAKSLRHVGFEGWFSADRIAVTRPVSRGRQYAPIVRFKHDETQSHTQLIESSRW